MVNNTMDITMRAKLHEVYLTETECTRYEEDDMTVFNVYRTTEWNRGDVLAVKGKWGYRNMWKAMWDGNTAIMLGREYGDYMHVANEFVVGREFHALYWENVITYNYVIHANFEECSNIDEIKEEYKGKDMYGKMFSLKGERWLVMSMEGFVPEEELRQTEMYSYLHEEHWEDTLKRSRPLSRKYDIPFARILWRLE